MKITMEYIDYEELKSYKSKFLELSQKDMFKHSLKIESLRWSKYYELMTNDESLKELSDRYDQAYNELNKIKNNWIYKLFIKNKL
jgi:hypothetical protein